MEVAEKHNFKKCPNCGKYCSNISQHWRQYCEYPDLTPKHLEICTGLLMGDGCITVPHDNPNLVVNMTSPNYLLYLHEIFGVFSRDMKFGLTAKENAERVRKRGLNPNADPDNYSDSFVWSTCTHPDLERFIDWYSSGKKIWPEDIELTPTVLKHWYCCDGSWNNNGSNNYIRLYMANERENTNKVSNYFESSGLPSPKYDIHKRRERYGGGMKCAARFTVDQSEELWEYMGEPLPDFEYKWPDKFK